MPASRENSVGPNPRRGGQRAHRPYNDDLTQGKRTGIPIFHDPDSDDIQPFDQLLGTLDTRTPPRVLGRARSRKSSIRPPSPIYEDEYGEESMDIDANDSPNAYFNKSRKSLAPPSISRTGSTRPLARTSDVDFDRVPSPRAGSAAGSRRLSKAPARSNLARFQAVPDDDEDDDDEQPARASSSRRSVARNGRDSPDGTLPLSPRPTNVQGGRRSSVSDWPPVARRQSVASHFSARSSYAPRGDDTLEDAALDDGGFDMGGPEPEFEPVSVPGGTPGRTSFTQMDRDDDDDDDEDDVPIAQLSRISAKDKGKGKAVDPVPEPEVDDAEDELERGMEDDIVHQDAPDDYGDEQPEEPEEQEPEPEVEKPSKVKRKRTKTNDEEADTPKSKPKKPKSADKGHAAKVKRVRPASSSKPPSSSRNHKENVEDIRIPIEDVEDDEDAPPGVRRGRRVRYAPLEYWRLERVEYGAQREVPDAGSAQIRAIIRKPKEDVLPLAARRRKGARGRSKPASARKMVLDAQELEAAAAEYNPEEGWDEQTDPMGRVKDFVGGGEHERRIVWTETMMMPKQADNADFMFQKVFGDGEFVAAGQLIIPPSGEKPPKNAKDNTYVFYVIAGAIEVKVHSTSFILCSGGMFLVPRGNMYYIKNIAQRETKLFFAQARQIPLDDQSPMKSPRKARTASAGPSSDHRPFSMDREPSVKRASTRA